MKTKSIGHKRIIGSFLSGNQLRQISKENISDWLKDFSSCFGVTGATLYIISKGSSEHLGDYKNRVDLLTDFSLSKNYDGISEITVEQQKPLVFNDRTNKKSYDPENDYAALASFPIVRSGEIVAVLNLGSDKVGYFDDKLVDEIDSYSDVIAVLLEASLKLANLPLLEKQVNQYKEKFKAINSEYNRLSNDKGKIDQLSDKINYINNQLSIIAGNIQCLSVENSCLNQKERQRIKRIETSSNKIFEAIEELKKPV